MNFTSHFKKSIFALTVLLSLAFFSDTLSGQSKNIVLDMKDAPLSSVFKEISAQSEYKFVYNNNAIDAGRTVSIKMESSDIEKILNCVFENMGITYLIVDNQIALSPAKNDNEPEKEVIKDAGKRVITGKVTDNEGEPMVGADIYEKGTTNGVFADEEGKYSITISDDSYAALVFNFIGMKRDTVLVGKRGVINLVMTLDSKMLDQVVVTGYQTISRERSAGSFAKVEGKAIQDKANAQGNVLKSLEGTVAGLNVVTTAEGSSYYIRGISSINSKTTPLFIVDGVAMPQEVVEKMISGNDVSSVTFLKDATAASIWGSQAANGVVVMTTKTGSSSTKLAISYNGSFTYQGKPDYSYQDKMSSSDFIKTATEVFDPNTYPWGKVSTSTYGMEVPTYPCVYPHELPLYQYFSGEISLAERDARLNKLASQNGRKEYEDYFMSDSWLTNHSVSLSGGNDRNNYYVSLEYQGEKGINRDYTSGYKVYVRDMLNVTKWMHLDLSVNAYYSDSRSYLNSEDDELGIVHLTSLPYASYYDEYGNELSLTNYLMSDSIRENAESITGFSLGYNPVSDYRMSTYDTQSYSIRANAGLIIDIFDGLKYEGRFQYSINNSNSEVYYPAETFKVRLDRAYATNMDGDSYLPSTGGYFTMGDNYNASYTVRNQLSYDKRFGEKVDNHISLLAGIEFTSDKYSNHSSYMRGYDMQTMQYIDYDDYNLYMTGVLNPVISQFGGASTNIFSPNSYLQGETEYRYVSVYANGAYTLMDKYSLNASVRVDQSNLFGSDPSVQFKPIWSVGAIWNIGKESFMKGAGKVDNLNLRLSYGYAGNSPNPGQGGPYNIISSVSDPTYSRFGLGYVVSTPANDKLTWEKTRIVNVGVDFAFFENRLSGSLDLYDKYTTNLLAYTPIDPTTGYIKVLSNAGIMTNRGVELSLSSVNIQRKNFIWSTDFNVTYNRNELTKMYIEPPSSPYQQRDQEYTEGYPLGAIFAYKWAGLDPNDGLSRVYDSNGNVVRSEVDIDNLSAVPYMGTSIPPWFGSLTNNIRYKGFELSFMFIYNLGHVMRNDINEQFSYRLTGSLHNDFAKRWRQPGDEMITDVPAYYSLMNTSINGNDVLNLYKYSDVNILDASYIKLRDISLAYYLPSKACRAMKAESAYLRLQVSNVWLIPFNKEGIDPESFNLKYGSRGDLYKPSVTATLSINF